MYKNTFALLILVTLLFSGVAIAQEEPQSENVTIEFEGDKDKHSVDVSLINHNNCLTIAQNHKFESWFPNDIEKGEMKDCNIKYSASENFKIEDKTMKYIGDESTTSTQSSLEKTGTIEITVTYKKDGIVKDTKGKVNFTRKFNYSQTKLPEKSNKNYTYEWKMSSKTNEMLIDKKKVWFFR